MAAEAKHSDRDCRIQRIVDDCISRRADGEALTTEQILEVHSDLLPELGDALRKLSVVERALGRFREASGTRGPQDIAGPRPNSFPGYEIVGEVHRGGQAIVYEAIQQRTQRRVAIKVMPSSRRGGVDGVIRFEREVAILGRLDHPNVLTIHDTGSNDDYFYYVADLIDGEPLDAFVAAQGPSTRETIGLFVKVCDAVTAAHLIGVIHRDLKPGNVLVDEDAEPHVLDFGLAKLSSDTGDGVTTATNGFVGSLPWAAPEQVRGASADVDVRTDVYALGVMLYQALTHRFPYTTSGSMHEVMKNILSVEPRRPSRIRAQLGDEVDTVVLKCLAKDPAHRYQSAGELGRDLRHYLADEPIDAKRDSIRYVLGKHLRKHKIHVGVAGAFLVVIAASLVTSIAFWRRAATERDTAIVARSDARRQAENATAANEFLREVVSLASPARALGRAITIREAVDMAAGTIDAFSSGREETEAAIRVTLGTTYHSLGHFDVASQQFEIAAEIQQRLLGHDHPATLATMSKQASALGDLGQTQAAIRLFDQVISLQAPALGTGHRDTLQSYSALAWILFGDRQVSKAEPLFRTVLEGSRKLDGPMSPTTLRATTNLAGTLIAQGKLEDARPLAIRGATGLSRTLGARHPTALYARNMYGWYLYEAERYAEAEPQFAGIVEDATIVLGSDHPHRLYWLGNLARCHLSNGKLDEAEAAFEEAIAGEIRVLPAGHAYVFEAKEGLARTLIAQQRYAEAERLALETHQSALTRFGEHHPITSTAAAVLVDLDDRASDSASQTQVKTSAADR